LSGVTSCEALPYPCLTDPQQRHWIQDLATSTDFVLNRIASDVAVVDQRPKAQARRMNADQAMVANVATVVTYDTADFQPTDPTWIDLGNGLIAPTVAGVYFVEGRVSRGAPAGNAYVLDLQYNSVTIMSRKFDAAAGGGLLENQGISGLAVVTLPLSSPGAAFRMRFNPITNASVVRRARMAVQWLGRCNPPINANPYFEKNVNNWSVVGGGPFAIAWSTTQARRGNASMRITPTVAGWTVGSEHVLGVNGNAAAYQAVAFVRTTTGSRTMSIQLAYYTSADVFITSSGSPAVTVNNTSWTMLVTSNTPPVNAARVQLRLVDLGAGLDVTYIDDAYVYKACGT
jgi:hypothetical protein